MCWKDLWSYDKVRKRICFQAHMVVSRTQFPTGYQPEVALSSLSHRPLHKEVPNMATGFFRVSKQEGHNTSKRHRVNEMKLVFCYLIMKVAPQHFCCILFIRNKSVGPAHIQRRGITQGHEYQEAEIIRACARSCLLRTKMAA